MAEQRIETELLALTGQLLLEYNESTGEIHRALATTAHAITSDKLDVAINYGGVVVSLGDGTAELKPVHELRYNATLQARIHAILDGVRRGECKAAAAVTLLHRAEADTPRHNRWIAAALLGIAATCLAILLGADGGAALVAGLSTALGLVARQELARRHFALLMLPFAAAFVGAALGGIAFRLNWTHTPGLAVIVPSLMLVPGPHLINGLLDLVDNHLPMSVARLTLAMGILLASALGIILGMALTLPELPPAGQAATTDHLNLVSDMFLAGIVTCGFAMYYNAAWAHIGMAALGGMGGHGLRYLAVEAGCRLDVATFIGGMAVGIVAAIIARVYKVPFAVAAFAGAVTMMPGLQMYRALGGALQLAKLKDASELPTIAGTLGNASQAFFVVSALAVGLIVASRLVFAVIGRFNFYSGTQR